MSNQYGYPGEGNNGNFVGGNNGNFGGGNNNYRPHDGGHSYDDGHNDNQDYVDNYVSNDGLRRPELTPFDPFFATASKTRECARRPENDAS